MAAGNGIALYSGSELALLTLLEPANRHFSYGWDVEPTGDLDRDGVLDLAVSSSDDDSGGLRSGAVYLHSGANGAVLDVLFGSSPEERFGFAMERLPDMDADGVDDLAISSTFLLDLTSSPCPPRRASSKRPRCRSGTSRRGTGTSTPAEPRAPTLRPSSASTSASDPVSA